jgi:glycosyltransferase involved in cell wall biosynthesis
VFPSRTETFGNVLLEAMASGLPVAAVPAPGPLDLIQDGRGGALDHSLLDACLRAVSGSSTEARNVALRYGWPASHERFRSHLVPLQPQASWVLSPPAVAH